jgi:DNA polymerase-3 subunit beta
VPQARACAGCIDKTHFSMAQQDVRYYLNGTLLEAAGKIAAIGGDRRPPSALLPRPRSVDAVRDRQQVIVPRKGVAGAAARRWATKAKRRA